MSKLLQNFLFNAKIDSIFYKASLRRSLIDVPHTQKTMLEEIGITTGKINKIHVLPINKKTALNLLKNKELVAVEVVKVDHDVILSTIKEYYPEFTVTEANAEQIHNDITPEGTEAINNDIRKFVEEEFKAARKISPGFSVVRH